MQHRGSFKARTSFPVALSAHSDGISKPCKLTSTNLLSGSASTRVSSCEGSKRVWSKSSLRKEQPSSRVSLTKVDKEHTCTSCAAKSFHAKHNVRVRSVGEPMLRRSCSTIRAVPALVRPTWVRLTSATENSLGHNCAMSSPNGFRSNTSFCKDTRSLERKPSNGPQDAGPRPQHSKCKVLKNSQRLHTDKRALRHGDCKSRNFACTRLAFQEDPPQSSAAVKSQGCVPAAMRMSEAPGCTSSCKRQRA
mmetsp:Transcript_127736/g.367680  ORF Transcript_127736/g.367680 Transcript_127736/m.367680 type:complete len:249 (+) Transcript_127736:1302-2048(+)